MQDGAVAILDALGFRGIWQRAEPTKVLSTLKRVWRVCDAFVRSDLPVPEPYERLFSGEISPKLWMRTFSDTSIIGCGVTTKEERDLTTVRAVALHLVCNMASFLMGFASSTDLPLAYRGVVTCGQFDLDQQFLIGPAIDEAASEERKAEGALVWLSPSATSVMETVFDWDFGTHRIPVIRNYPVPMKGGHSFRTFVVDPLWNEDDDAAKKSAVERILGTFLSERVDVVIKRQRTEAYLQHAMMGAGAKGAV